MLVRPVPPKLLLVDDRPANLLALEAVLGSKDYTLLKAQSGSEALAVLASNPDVAVVLLDVQMPIMDGFEVARRIKADPALREIPVIFITAIHTEDPHIRAGYEAGGIDYFSKPFDPEILKLKVVIYASFRQRANLLREKERQLRESEELIRAGRRLTAVLETLPVGVIITDREGRVCQGNDEALALLHSLTPTRDDRYGEMLGWWDHDGQQLKARGGPLMRALTEERASHNEIVRIKCVDGTTKSVFASGSPLLGLDKRLVGAVLVLQDVTAQATIKADLEQRIVRLVSLGVGFEEQAVVRTR